MNKPKQSNSTSEVSGSKKRWLVTNLRTIRQVSESCPAFGEGSLRWLIFNAATNGLEGAVVRVGRRVLIDIDQFDLWVKQRSDKSQGVVVIDEGGI